jgi:amino acid adenylation domain-containing protein
VFSVIEQGDGTFSGAFEYAHGAMAAGDAERMAGHLLRLLEGAVADPDRHLGCLPLLAPAERDWLVRAGAGAASAPARLVHDAVVEAGTTRADAGAISDPGGSVTHAELRRRADGLAWALYRSGIGPGDRVGILLPRGVDLGVAILGTLRCGAAYVPVDPDNPADRIAMILADCGARALITRRHGLPAAVVGMPIVEPSGAVAEGPPPVEVEVDDVAYVLYTSGSTGRPKGAMITHRALANYVDWFVEEFGVTGADRVLAATTPSFDAFGIEFFPPLWAGGQVVMAPAGLELDPPALLRFAAERGVTMLATVPALLRIWAAEPELGGCTGVRQVVCGGEPLDRDLVERIFSVLPVPVTNLYGPTEATIDVSYHTCVPGRPVSAHTAVPIGRPLRGATLSVHLPGGALAPVGVPGELFVGGVPLSLGYLGRPGETASRFRPHPNGGSGRRWYATGDRVVWLASGDLLFAGRDDGQVKLNGYRLELAEVAAVARGCPGVTDAAAAVTTDATGRRQLVLYVAGGRDPDPGPSVLALARARLPRPMVPTRVVVVPRLPLLPNGKLDLRALAATEPRATEPRATEQRATEPRAADSRAAEPAATGTARSGDGSEAGRSWGGSIAARLREIFQQTLRTEDVGDDDSFFEWGGDSITAIQVAARAKAAGLDITVADVLAMETVRNLANLVTSGGDAATVAPAPVAPRPPVGSSPATGAVPFTPAQRWFLDRGSGLTTAQQYCLLAADPLTGREVIEAALAALITAHEALRLAWRRTDADWTQELTDPYPVAVVDHQVPPAGCDSGGVPIDRYLRGLLSPFDLADGRALRAYRLVTDDRAFLLLSAHHRAVDAVTWRMLLAELRARLRGEPVAPARSFVTASRSILDAATGPAIDQARDYWVDALAKLPPPLLDQPPGQGEYDLRQIAVAVDHGRAEEVLLAAVLTAIGRRDGGVMIDLEGHGRDILGDVDAAGVAGWFTALFPLVIPGGAADPAESLRQARRHGSRYGVLRFGGGLAPVRTAEVALNYVGRLPAIAGGPEAWTPVGAPLRAFGEHLLEPGRLMEIDAVMVGRTLLVDLAVRTTPAPAAGLAAALADQVMAALVDQREDLR